jgi:hypothetical protein
VGDEIEMSILHPTDDLPEEELGLVFRDIIILYVVVEFAAVCEFHDDEDVIGSIEYFIELDDILMVDELEYLDLPLHLSRSSPTFEIIFLFFIFLLLMIFTATRTPVKSCLASNSHPPYLSP